MTTTIGEAMIDNSKPITYRRNVSAASVKRGDTILFDNEPFRVTEWQWQSRQPGKDRQGVVRITAKPVERGNGLIESISFLRNNRDSVAVLRTW